MRVVFHTIKRPINRADSHPQARFIGRHFVAGQFIAWRGRQLRQTTLIPLAILMMLFIVGCQTEKPALPQPIENGEQLTQLSATNEAPTAVPATSDIPPPPSTTANADVTFVRAIHTGDDTWTFHVTVDHPDTGWEDYADGWDVVLPDGTVVKPNETSPFTRLLTHPHETERPFTRSQSNITIPPSITSVTVRAHDLVDGFGGKEVVVDLTAVSGQDFEIEQ